MHSTKRLGRALLILTTVLFAGGAGAADARRPNVLFVYTDDQRWDAMGAVQREQGDRARFPWFTTPGMDRLVAEGVRFANAFVVNSLCSPSRAAFLTGRYNHENGVANNHTPFPPDSETHASLMRVAGYTTGYIGKWHMGSQNGKRPGFDYSASFIGQGRYNDCPFEIDGTPTPTEGWVDDRSTDFAIEFLKQNRDKPFSLIVGFKAAHGPFDPPDRARDRFLDAVARPVPNLDNPAIYLAAMQKAAQAKTKKAQAKKKEQVRNPAKAGEFEHARVNLNYFRCLSAADDNLGRLLSALDELGLADDTIVIFTSDNGYYLGEHRAGDKRTAYDESLRIPLLVRYPRLGLKGKVVDALALNIDLAPTLLDFAGLPAVATQQGRSWRSLLEGKPVDWRKGWFYEYFRENGYGHPTVLAYRTETAKLIKYPGHDDWTELFDLRADPYETRNLAGDADHRELLERLEAEYRREANAVHYRVPDYADETAP